MPDLSRSCWRKIICKNVTEDVKGSLSCGLQSGCPLTLLPQKGYYPCAVRHAPCSSSPASSGSCSTGSGTPPAQGGHCHLSGEQRVKEKAAREGTGIEAKPSDPRHLRQEKPGHPWPAQFYPQLPLSVLQHQQDQSLQPSRKSAMLKLAAVPLPGNSSVAAVGSTPLWCPRSKTGLACSKRGCCRPRLEKGSELLLYPRLTPQLHVLVQAGTQAMTPVTLHVSSSTAGHDGLGGKKPNSASSLPGVPQRLGGIMARQAGEPVMKGSTGRFLMEGKVKGESGAGLGFWRQSQGPKQAGELIDLSKKAAAKAQGCRAGGPEATRTPSFLPLVEQPRRGWRAKPQLPQKSCCLQAEHQGSWPLAAVPRGYIHQVDHVAAGVQAEPIRLQIFV